MEALPNCEWLKIELVDQGPRFCLAGLRLGGVWWLTNNSITWFLDSRIDQRSLYGDS